MIGGVIIYTQSMGNVSLLQCAEVLYDECGNRTSIGCNELCVRVKNEADMPNVGDLIWWQSGKVYWTPEDKRFEDKALEKIGYSFRPAANFLEENRAA
jgi:hypothetical protein